LARMFGYRGAAQLLGVPVARYIAPEDRKRVKAYGPAREAGKPVPEQYEFRGNHRSGKPLWIEARVAIVEWDGEQAWLVTMQDVTERKQTEQSLTQSEERFRQLVEGSVEGIAVLHGGKLVFVNHAYADIFGYRTPVHVLRRAGWESYVPESE